MCVRVRARIISASKYRVCISAFIIKTLALIVSGFLLIFICLGLIWIIEKSYKNTHTWNDVRPHLKSSHYSCDNIISRVRVRAYNVCEHGQQKKMLVLRTETIVDVAVLGQAKPTHTIKWIRNMLGSFSYCIWLVPKRHHSNLYLLYVAVAIC